MNIRIHKLRWKDKYDTPRVELLPSIEIELKYVYYIKFGSDDFWEQYLWLRYYGYKSEYPWVDSDTRQSSWTHYWILDIYNYIKYEFKHILRWRKKTERKN